MNFLPVKKTLPLVLILALCFALRLLHLNQSFWLDEAITAIAIRGNSFSELITRFALKDFHPPLYYLLLKLWSTIFGQSEIALRLPSVLFSVGTGFFVFLIGKKIWNSKVGMVAVLLWAVNPLAVYYAQEARMYSTAAFLVAVCVFGFLKKNWWIYGISLLLALLTDYMPIFLIPVFFLLAENRKKFLLVNLLIGLCLLPWAFFVSQQWLTAVHVLGNNPNWGAVLGAFDVKSLPLTFVKFIIGRITIDNKIVYGLLSAILLGLYGVIVFLGRKKFLLGWLFLPLILGLLVSVRVPIFSYFRFLFVLPAFVLLLAKGVEKSKFLLTIVCLFSFGSLMIFNLNQRFQRENWRGLMNYIAQETISLVFMPSVAQSAPLEYYLRNWPSGVSRPEVLDVNTFSTQNAKQVVLLRYVQEIFDPKDILRTRLENEGFKKTKIKDFNGVIIWEYEKDWH